MEFNIRHGHQRLVWKAIPAQVRQTSPDAVIR